MCIGILKGDTWKPSSRITNVLIATQNLLIEPVPDDALEASSADLFKTNRPAYEKEAKKYTAQYAVAK
jgi:ubiquitin-conjugating enzyme E2 D/E